MYRKIRYGSNYKYMYSIMTSSNGNIFRVTGPLCGEFTGPGEFPTQRPVTRSFGVFFVLRLSKRLSKQPWDWWFETPSWSLWRQCNAASVFTKLIQLRMQNMIADGCFSITDTYHRSELISCRHRAASYTVSDILRLVWHIYLSTIGLVFKLFDV